MSDARFTSAINDMNKRREETGIDMNGKKYARVSDRVEVFRQIFGGDYGISTDIKITRELGGQPVVIAHAQVMDAKTGIVMGSGHSMAYYGSDEVNTQSIIEATETAAIGRALSSFGLAGGEYASDKEMEAIPAKKAATANLSGEPRKIKQGSKEPAQSREEAEFREAVDRHFPPSVNQYNFFVPDNVDKESIDNVFAQIDSINDMNELSAYWTVLEETMQWMVPEDAKEVQASFSTRKKQLKGR